MHNKTFSRQSVNHSIKGLLHLAAWVLH